MIGIMAIIREIPMRYHTSCTTYVIPSNAIPQRSIVIFPSFLPMLR